MLAGAMLLLISTEGWAQTSYYWTGADRNKPTDWSEADNWRQVGGAANATRSTPRSTDILIFDGAMLTNRNLVISFNYNPQSRNQTVGQLRFVNGVKVQLSAPGTSNDFGSITLDGGFAGDDFVVDATSTLDLTSSSNTDNRFMLLVISAGETGRVEGTINFTSANSGGLPNRLMAADPNSLVFASGSAFNATNRSAGHPFGTTLPLNTFSTTENTSSAGSVLFEAGATYSHQGGADPFGGNGTAGISTVATFQEGSSYIYSGGTFSPVGRQYGNLAFQASTIVADAPSMTILNNLSVTPNGITPAVVNLNSTGGTSVAGNISVASNSTLTFTPGTLASVTLNGTAADQGISGSGTLTFGTNALLAIDNPQGVTLSRAVTVQRGLQFSSRSGKLNTSVTGMLTMPSSAPVLNPSELRFVNGPMTRIQSEIGPVALGSDNSGLFYPVGQGNAYRPVSLTLRQSSATATTYVVTPVEGSPTIRTMPPGSGILYPSRVRHVKVESGRQTSLAQGFITMTFEADDQVDNLVTLRVLRGTGSDWINMDIENASGTPIAGTPYLRGRASSISWAPIDGFGDFVFASAQAGTNPLPVELTSFNAVRQAKAILLNWATAQEKNNARFEVQRSANGREFATIATVRGNGTSSGAHSYSHIDEQPLSDVSYYRLRQVDRDGTDSYSPIVTVKGGAEQVLLTPNPTTAHLGVKFTGSEVQWRILNVTGQVMKKGSVAANGTLDVSDLRAGVYFFEVTAEGQRSIQKFLKQD